MGRAARAVVRACAASTLGLLVISAGPALARVEIVGPARAGFDQRLLVDGLTRPTAAALAPDGRVFVTDKAGRLMVAMPGDPTPRLVVDLRSRVHSFSDRGLTGLALDADFATAGSPYAGRIYLLYAHDAHGRDVDRPTTSRLTHVTVDKRNRARRERVILDDLPAEDRWHNAGTVRADADGTLWVGTGDATAGFHPRALEALDPSFLRGKILHVDRTGRGVADHPFCPEVSDLTRPCTKVFAAGFRNPFRFHPVGDGRVVVGDVGSARHEELSLVRAGERHGWPCYEAFREHTVYSDLCTEWTGPLRSQLTWPTHTYPHEPGASVIAGPLYRGGRFPARHYGGAVFFGDYVGGWIRYRRPDGSIGDFANGWYGVQLDPDPSGERLVSVTFNGGTLDTGGVWLIAHSPGDRSPVARARARPAQGAPPLTVGLSAKGSSDADGDPLRYRWDLGDGTRATGRTITHTYERPGRYTPRVTARDPRGRWGTDRVAVVAGRPPSLRLRGDTTFRPGGRVRIDASARDPEDGVLGPDRFSWQVDLVHEDHVHEYTAGRGRKVDFAADEEHAADGLYRVRVTAVDSHGLLHTVTRRVRYRPHPAG